MKYETVRIVVREFGDVEKTFVKEIIDIMSDCYNRIKSQSVKIVDLYLFEKSSIMNAFVNLEKRKFGIETSALEENFFAVHDAWHGTPRIMVAYDKAMELPNLVKIGGFHHEVAHTVLHGSLEHYLFSFPTRLITLEREGTISERTGRDLLYLASIAVKDFEVTRLLYRKGYIEDQVVYNKYFLEPTEEDYEVWELAQNNENTRLIVLVSILKPACCASPIQENERYGKEIGESIKKSMNHLPLELSMRLLALLELTNDFRENTHENVTLFMKKIIDELIITR